MHPGLLLELVASVINRATFGSTVQWGRLARPLAPEMTEQTLLVHTEGLAHLAPGFLPGGRVSM